MDFSNQVLSPVKAEKRLKPLWKQTVFLFTALPEHTRTVQKVVLAVFPFN